VSSTWDARRRARHACGRRARKRCAQRGSVGRSPRVGRAPRLHRSSYSAARLSGARWGLGERPPRKL